MNAAYCNLDSILVSILDFTTVIIRGLEGQHFKIQTWKKFSDQQVLRWHPIIKDTHTEEAKECHRYCQKNWKC